MDVNLGDYYLRQRYYNSDSGRFTRRDTYEGELGAPFTLHKYIYANANPIAFTDPSGYIGITEVLAVMAIFASLAAISSQMFVNVASLLAGNESPKDDVIVNIGYSPLITSYGLAAWGHASIQVDNEIYDYPRAEPDGVNRYRFMYDEQTQFQYYYHRFSINYDSSQKEQLKANLKTALSPTGNYSRRTPFQPFFHNCAIFVRDMLPDKPNNDWRFGPLVKATNNFSPFSLDFGLTAMSVISQSKTVKTLSDGLVNSGGGNYA